ncbi:MAG TPA: patatin-like phospholipase family protein [Elusimicrobiales bacterium]|nr:patatin-like phospholipase family protein [Elusimicrobiales bacterium]
MKVFINSLFLSALLVLAPAFCAAQESDDEILREALWTRLALARPPARPSVGLALSGGGARGFAHTGLLEVLEDSGFPVDYVSGTSMGSVIGALYSSGVPVADIWRFVLDASDLKVSRDFRSIKLVSLIIRDKLITPKYINQFIDRRLGGLTFEKLKKPFACSAMDIRTGEKIVFTEGPVDMAVRSSVNLPGIFAPVQYRQRYLVDGGVVDFIPVDSARALGAGWVLASVTDSSPDSMPENVLMSLLRVIDIRGSLLARSAEKKADFVIKPEVGDVGMADFAKCAEAGEAGVVEAFRRVEAAKEALLIYAAPCLAGKI